jgi:hypothetical protein
MSLRWRKVAKDEAKEKEEDREMQQVAPGRERPEQGQRTQVLLDLSQGEQPLSSSVKGFLRKITARKEEDKPQIQAQKNVQYRILTRQQKDTHTHHSIGDSVEGLLQQEQLRHEVHLPQQAGDHNQSNADKIM